MTVQLINAIASANPDFALHPADVLADHEQQFAEIAASVTAAGFVLTDGAAHTVADRSALIEAVCSVDPDYEDYPDYVKDGDRIEKAPIVDAIFDARYGIPR